MLTDKDIEKLISVLVTRSEFEEAISRLSTKEDIDKLMKAMDGYAKNTETYHQEMFISSHQIDRNAENIKKIDSHLKLHLEY